MSRFGIAALAVFVGLVVGAAPVGAVPGVIAEDESGWDCRTMGNRVCGPDNAQGVIAGQYGPDALIIPWPAATVPEWCGDICLGA